MIQQEYFGFNSINMLENILKNGAPRNIFLVTGRESFESCGAQKKLVGIFKNTNCDFTRFCDFSPNPKLEEIENGFDLFQQRRYDCIIGIGGGSSIDVAKSIKMLYFQVDGRKLPLVAIPTTAGSGSEATFFIVYYKGNEKQSKGNPNLTLPDYSICDPQFTLNLPKEITASTGMDALCQAIESYWSVHSTEESKKFAEHAIRMSMGNLEQAVNNPSKESRESMLKAANLAGKAINLTKTTACHSISYPVTYHFDVPHGHAVSLTLAEMLVYNSHVTEEDCNDRRDVDYIKRTMNEIANFLGVENVEEAYDKIKNFMASIGLETRLSNLGIDKKSKEIIVQEGFRPERVKNNPRLLTEEKLRRILENIY